MDSSNLVLIDQNEDRCIRNGNNNNSSIDRNSIPHPILINEENEQLQTCHNIFTCTICHDITFNPQILYPCEHIFCKTCIDQALQLRCECPNDRVQVSQIEPLSGALKRIHQNISVKCAEAPYCSWKGTMESYQNHAMICPAMSYLTIKDHQEVVTKYEQEIYETKSQYEEKIINLEIKMDQLKKDLDFKTDMYDQEKSKLELKIVNLKFFLNLLTVLSLMLFFVSRWT